MLRIFLLLLCTFGVQSALDYCDRERFPLITDLIPAHCDNNNGYYYVENAINSCFPGCVQRGYNRFNCSDARPCPPGYYCPQDNEVCQLNDNASCFKYRASIPDTEHGNTRWEPECLADGTWGFKQCQGEAANGRCFCVDADGNRIFGQGFSLEANDMSCACSRRRSDMERAGNHVFVSLHCDSEGNYEPLQCDVESQQCWCVRPKTGVLTSPVLPLALMARLPCYNRRLIGSQYLRRCESELYAQKMITNEFFAQGSTRVQFPLLFCQYDGSFGPLRFQRGIAFCIWRDNSVLGNYQAQGALIANMTCNCARDERTFALAGLSFTLSCLSDGSYNPLQFDGREFFCVDNNGFVATSRTPPFCQ